MAMKFRWLTILFLLCSCEPSAPAASPGGSPAAPHAEYGNVVSPVAVVIEARDDGSLMVDGARIPEVGELREPLEAARREDPAIVGLIITGPTVSPSRLAEIVQAMSSTGVRPVAQVYLADDEPFRESGVIVPLSHQPSGLVKRASLPQWRCVIPHEASKLGIDSASPVIRVLVGQDGTAKSVNILDDPGRGYGRVAAACAKLIRFKPASDVNGDSIEAMTPPIRVNFRARLADSSHRPTGR
jgi:hypothetical protein